MPSVFNRYISRSVGTANVNVGNYTVPAGTTVTVIGFTVSNISNSDITTSVDLFDGTNGTSIVRNAPVPVGGALVAVGSPQKIVLKTGDTIRVRCSAASAADVIMSVLELS